MRRVVFVWYGGRCVSDIGVLRPCIKSTWLCAKVTSSLLSLPRDSHNIPRSRIKLSLPLTSSCPSQRSQPHFVSCQDDSDWGCSAPRSETGRDFGETSRRMPRIIQFSFSIAETQLIVSARLPCSRPLSGRLTVMQSLGIKTWFVAANRLTSASCSRHHGEFQISSTCYVDFLSQIREICCTYETWFGRHVSNLLLLNAIRKERNFAPHLSSYQSRLFMSTNSKLVTYINCMGHTIVVLSRKVKVPPNKIATRRVVGKNQERKKKKRKKRVVTMKRNPFMWAKPIYEKTRRPPSEEI